MIPPADAPSAGRWNDLRTRVISAVVMVAIGSVCIWLGGAPFTVLVLLLTGLMIWELASMTSPAASSHAIIAALMAAAALGATVMIGWNARTAFLALPVIFLALTPRRFRLVTVVYSVAILAVGFGLITLRNGFGAAAILWLISVVIASDVMGYFAGRSLGGPKFWPAISPKKTWSGTVAGWVAAAVVGIGFVLFCGAGWGLVALSPIIAFAGQMGDIAESWLKRRTGVKDSSALIPGHGGVLDRFDAVIGATVAYLILAQVLPLPIFAGP